MVDTDASGFLVGNVVGELPRVTCGTSDVCHKWCVSCATSRVSRVSLDFAVSCLVCQ